MADNHRLTVNTGAKSDQGLERSDNQDRMLRFSSPFGEVFLVSDGMGGYSGGATAAEMVADGFLRHLNSLSHDEPIDAAIRTAAEKTNREILRLSRGKHAETAGMGATLALAIVSGDALVVAHVGDSRAYLYRDRELRQLTRDHTQGRDNVEAGLLSEDEAFDHLSSSVLTRAFGHSDPLEPEVALPMKLEPGDQILLCSDGLSGYVQNKAIAEVFVRGLEPQQTADCLVQLANITGGADNVTVQIIAAGPVNRGPAPRNRNTLVEGLPATPRSDTVSKTQGKRHWRFWHKLFILS